jgi:hypothetical protein
MSKLKLVILATMLVWAGFESRQTATAAQSSPPVMTKTTYPRGVVTDPQHFVLAKACTLKRYRRPR